MSSSEVDSKIDLLDTEDAIKKKIKKACCAVMSCASHLTATVHAGVL